MSDELSVVSSDDDRRPTFVNLAEEIHDFKGQFRIKVSSGLVSQNNLRIVDDGSSDSDSLLLSVGEMGGVIPHPVMKINHSQSIEDFPSDILSRYSQDLEDDGNIVKNFFMEKKTEVLEDHAHAPAEFIDFMSRNPQDIPAVNDDLTLGREELPKNYFEKGRFS